MNVVLEPMESVVRKRLGGLSKMGSFRRVDAAEPDLKGLVFEVGTGGWNRPEPAPSEDAAAGGVEESEIVAVAHSRHVAHEPPLAIEPIGRKIEVGADRPEISAVSLPHKQAAGGESACEKENLRIGRQNPGSRVIGQWCGRHGADKRLRNGQILRVRGACGNSQIERAQAWRCVSSTPSEKR